MEDRPVMLQMKHTQKVWMDYMRSIALGAGVPEAYRQVLVYIARHPGTTQKQVADECRITGAAVSRTISDMLKDGYIRRETGADDKRNKLLYLTELGDTASKKMREKIKTADARIKEILGEDREREISRALREIEQAISGGLGNDVQIP